MHSSLLALLSLLSAISVDASPTPLLMRRAPLRAIKRRSVPVRRQAPANYGPAPMGDVPADYKPVYQDGHIKVIGNGTFAFNPNATTSNNPKLGGGTGKTRTVPAKACFPGFGTAPTVPSTNATAASLKNWWCSQNDEYAFLGFSYSLSSCPSLAQLNTDFRNQRQTYNARAFRLSF